MLGWDVRGAFPVVGVELLLPALTRCCLSRSTSFFHFLLTSSFARSATSFDACERSFRLLAKNADHRIAMQDTLRSQYLQ